MEKFVDEDVLKAIAGDLNAVPLSAGSIVAHLPNVGAVNARIADAAPGRLRVDRPPALFDTLRAQHTTSHRP
jgi:hypothetical protein